MATTLGNISNMTMVHLAAGYGDIPVAAYGIVKRIDQFPLNVSMGLCQGFMPLVGHNFAAVNFLISYTLQAMGKGVQSAVLTACRQGVLNVPLLIFMNHMVGLYGMIWTQLVVEVIMLPVSFGMYRATFRHLPAGPPAGGSA